ncbi:outer membrane protein assembly factor BamE [Alkalisalibacterium limincola]|jgi:outer membrane protein assembly factor BamE|uniref:Outer membrane protein assembly factor BamE n=1 Tax=Alkalisalibacterium limincola TaxID=2699169 RepID=A0A5C8KVC0_9GAMM|nr:outer membrane protein assembly factor BamE [Alkalisalibacterium limincola]TXK64412.1 outer membrane protein assembly factor BamE [Alkalisalibacterium limincola]
MKKLFVSVIVLAMLSGCAFIYRQPVHQGNLLETRQVDQLEVGMTRRQVMVLLGSPSVADPFHQDRWDYVSSQRRGRGEMEVKNLTVRFDGDVVSGWEGEYFQDQNQTLAREMGRFGNLPRERGR